MQSPCKESHFCCGTWTFPGSLGGQATDCVYLLWTNVTGKWTKAGFSLNYKIPALLWRVSSRLAQVSEVDLRMRISVYYPRRLAQWGLVLSQILPRNIRLLKQVLTHWPKPDKSLMALFSGWKIRAGGLRKDVGCQSVQSIGFTASQKCHLDWPLSPLNFSFSFQPSWQHCIYFLWKKINSSQDPWL